MSAQPACHLGDRQAYTARACKNQHPFPGRYTSEVEQCAFGHDMGQRKCGASGKGEAVGKWAQPGSGGGHMTRHGPLCEADNRISDPKLGHAISHGHDLARALPPETQIRRCGARRIQGLQVFTQAECCASVELAEPGGVYTHCDFKRFWLRDFPCAQHHTGFSIRLGFELGCEACVATGCDLSVIRERRLHQFRFEPAVHNKGIRRTVASFCKKSRDRRCVVYTWITR